MLENAKSQQKKKLIYKIIALIFLFSLSKFYFKIIALKRASAHFWVMSILKKADTKIENPIKKNRNNQITLVYYP